MDVGRCGDGPFAAVADRVRSEVVVQGVLDEGRALIRSGEPRQQVRGAAHLAEGIQGGRHCGDSLQIRRRYGDDGATGRGPHLSGHDVRMVRRAQNEIGDQGDAETRGDETLDGNVILGLEGDLGGKAALATHLKEVAPTAGAPGCWQLL